MTNPMRLRSWPPYLVGAGIGVLSWFAFAVADRPLGISTAFENSAAMGIRAAAPEFARTSPYFERREAAGKPLRIDAELMLVVGVLLGALLSAGLSGDRSRAAVPSPWRERFGPSVPVRLAAAFLGGGLMMLGARLAGGCTSGHGISGALQLAVSSWIFLPVIFVAGIATATLLYGRQEVRHDV